MSVSDGQRLTAEQYAKAYEAMRDILQSIHGQLQFAEAKNGALLAVNLATVAGIGAMISGGQIHSSFVSTWLCVTAFGLAGSALLALVSILPIGGLHRLLMAGTENPADANLLYWGDISRFSPRHFASALFAALAIHEQPGRLFLDFADQIVVNSGIARRKFAIFKVAATVTLMSATVPVVVLAFAWAGNGFNLE